MLQRMKHAIVTGTSRGIGTATAKFLLESGWYVTGVARGAAPQELAHDRYEHASLDLSNPAATEAWFERDFAPRMDAVEVERWALINNAGALDPMKPVARLGAEETVRAFTLNVSVPLWLMGFSVRLAANTPLRIVNLSSGAATSAYPGWAAYCGGKAALKMVGEVLALELDEVEDLKGRDVAIVAYAPHVVATRMQQEIREMDASDFPRHERFVELDREGALVAPEDPAREIAEWVERNDLPRFDVRRYQP